MVFTRAAQHQQQVETLALNFAQLVMTNMNKNESAPTKCKKNKKKSCRSAPIKIPNRNKSKDKRLLQIDHVEEWLHHRSAHYAWWRKPVAEEPQFDRTCCPKETGKSGNVAVKDRPKRQRCILWFEFAGRPFNGLTKSATSATERRKHSIRIDQQPLGGATAIVFAADLHIGEKFGLVSRRQPGFTLSLTFFIDGVRHARLSGCCENARNIHIPTRIGGPTGAFILETIQGGQQCHTCGNSTILFNRELFTVRPKCQKNLRANQDSDGVRHSQSKVAIAQKRGEEDLAKTTPTYSSDSLFSKFEAPGN